MSLLRPALRRCVFLAPFRPSVCAQCLRRTASPAAAATALPQATSNILNAVRATRGYARETEPSTTPLQHLGEQLAHSRQDHAGPGASSSSSSESKEGAGKGFPKTSSKAVGYWLLGSAASVFGIVVWGGLTRLTESGLSITEWKPVTGSLPPMSAADWDSEFTKYRSSPEFKLLNPHMTLDEFKKIYFMEWAHRVWGRFIGLSFALPTIYFIARRRVSRPMALNLLGITGLIGFQGIIGWWMVKSGLKDDLFAPGSHPRVSQYRLTTHLGTAFICYAWMLLCGLSILRTRRLTMNPLQGREILTALRNPALTPFRRATKAVAALVFITAMSGGLVAGLDAGLIYNEFPLMGVGLTPPRSELWSDFYSRRDDRSDLWWRNMLENPSTVQMDHRILAVSTFCAIMALWAYSRTGRVAAAMPKNIKKGTLGLVHLVSLQVALGISTLIYIVPIPLAAAHQAGSLAVLTGALVLASRLHVPKHTLKQLERQLQLVKPKATGHNLGPFQKIRP